MPCHCHPKSKKFSNEQYFAVIMEGIAIQCESRGPSLRETPAFFQSRTYQDWMYNLASHCVELEGNSVAAAFSQVRGIQAPNLQLEILFAQICRQSPSGFRPITTPSCPLIHDPSEYILGTVMENERIYISYRCCYSWVVCARLGLLTQDLLSIRHQSYIQCELPT